MAAVACPYNDLGNPEPSILKPDFSLHHLNLNLKPQTLFQYLKVQWLSIFSSQEQVERYHIYIPLSQYSLPASLEMCRAIKSKRYQCPSKERDMRQQNMRKPAFSTKGRRRLKLANKVLSTLAIVNLIEGCNPLLLHREILFCSLREIRNFKIKKSTLVAAEEILFTSLARQLSRRPPFGGGGAVVGGSQLRSKIFPRRGFKEEIENWVRFRFLNISKSTNILSTVSNKTFLAAKQQLKSSLGQ